MSSHVRSLGILLRLLFVRTGQVAEMLSCLDVRGDTGKTDEMAYEGMWDTSPTHESDAVYASSSSQESLGVYACPSTGANKKEESGLTYPDSEDGTPPAAASYSISQSSELAFALCGMQEDNSKQQQQQQQHYSSSAQGQGGDELLEMHHALAGFAELMSMEELSSAYSIGTFTTSEQQESEIPFNMY